MVSVWCIVDWSIVCVCVSSGSVFVRDSTECKLLAACQQFRTRDCTQLDIFLFCVTKPIIESSTTIRLGCYQCSYPQLAGISHPTHQALLNWLGHCLLWLPVTQTFGPQRNSNLGSLAPQAGMLPLDHCDLLNWCFTINMMLNVLLWLCVKFLPSYMKLCRNYMREFLNMQLVSRNFLSIAICIFFHYYKENWISGNAHHFYHSLIMLLATLHCYVQNLHNIKNYWKFCNKIESFFKPISRLSSPFWR